MAAAEAEIAAYAFRTHLFAGVCSTRLVLRGPGASEALERLRSEGVLEFIAETLQTAAELEAPPLPPPFPPPQRTRSCGGRSGIPSSRLSVARSGTSASSKAEALARILCCRPDCCTGRRRSAFHWFEFTDRRRSCSADRGSLSVRPSSEVGVQQRRRLRACEASRCTVARVHRLWLRGRSSQAHVVASPPAGRACCSGRRWLLRRLRHHH